MPKKQPKKERDTNIFGVSDLVRSRISIGVSHPESIRDQLLKLNCISLGNEGKAPYLVGLGNNDNGVIISIEYALKPVRKEGEVYIVMALPKELFGPVSQKIFKIARGGGDPFVEVVDCKSNGDSSIKFRVGGKQGVPFHFVTKM